MRLRDRLVEVFGIERIFTDVDSIEPGQDFTKALEGAVEVAVSFSPSSGKTG